MAWSWQGESSDADDAADSKVRARCGQFVWPCPRSYFEDAGVRKARKSLLPADLSKEEAGKVFLQVITKCNQLSNMTRLHVFDEPHRKYDKTTGHRARHKHFIFKFQRPFAHARMAQLLAQAGLHGHFSFNLVGYQAYLRYCLTPSSHKLEADLDKDPWNWPPAVTTQQLMSLCQTSLPQMEGRNGAAGRKRSLMTFSEITDAFVENSVRTSQDAWTLAKTRKVAGDETLWNTLGSQADVAVLVHKIVTAWNCESMESGTHVSSPDYTLVNFSSLPDIHERLTWWLQEGHKQVSLILQGAGGLGKTELAWALMHECARGAGFHFLNRFDRLRDVLIGPGQGLVFDEVCLADRTIDDAKSIVDLSKTRDVVARNKDGKLPKHTPRAFSTNWAWDQFWPREARLVEHHAAITRRVLWVHITQDVRRLPNAAVQEEGHFSGSEEEDVFGHGRDAL